MTEILFYLSDHKGTRAQFDLVCRLLKRRLKHAETRNLKTYIHVQEQQTAEELDEALWVFEPSAFIPHCLYPHHSTTADILIGCEPPPKQMDCLFNLSTQPVPAYDQFKQLSELVPADEQAVQLARERYRLYRSQQHPLKTFKMNGIYHRHFLSDRH